MRDTVAALYVDPHGIYSGLDGIECWGLPDRDAREYAGPWPVVAHPPCARWCRLAGLVEARWGHKRGEDDGCFAAALASVRRWGGVLEHPAYSDAWTAFDLPRPSVSGWQRGICGGWACHVEQWRYGHAARKATWLYTYGADLPSLKWVRLADASALAIVDHGEHRPKYLISWCGNHVRRGGKRRRLHKREASATPPAFRDVLLSIARSVHREAENA